MKIFEIDNIDRSWAELSGINLDIDSIFKETISVLDTLSKLKSPHRNQYWIPIIESTEATLQKIIDAPFADDTSTKDLKIRASRMLEEIIDKKNRLL
jgi:hypothetical protein